MSYLVISSFCVLYGSPIMLSGFFVAADDRDIPSVLLWALAVFIFLLFDTAGSWHLRQTPSERQPDRLRAWQPAAGASSWTTFLESRLASPCYQVIRIRWHHNSVDPSRGGLTAS
jgi:hypothetical protein